MYGNQYSSPGRHRQPEEWPSCYGYSLPMVELHSPPVRPAKPKPKSESESESESTQTGRAGNLGYYYTFPAPAFHNIPRYCPAPPYYGPPRFFPPPGGLPGMDNYTGPDTTTETTTTETTPPERERRRRNPPVLPPMEPDTTGLWHNEISETVGGTAFPGRAWPANGTFLTETGTPWYKFHHDHHHDHGHDYDYDDDDDDDKVDYSAFEIGSDADADPVGENLERKAVRDDSSEELARLLSRMKCYGTKRAEKEKKEKEKKEKEKEESTTSTSVKPFGFLIIPDEVGTSSPSSLPSPSTGRNHGCDSRYHPGGDAMTSGIGVRRSRRNEEEEEADEDAGRSLARRLRESREREMEKLKVMRTKKRQKMLRATQTKEGKGVDEWEQWGKKVREIEKEEKAGRERKALTQLGKNVGPGGGGGGGGGGDEKESDDGNDIDRKEREKEKGKEKEKEKEREKEGKEE